jgi:hypothetical protein
MQREQSMKAIATVLARPRGPGLPVHAFKAWQGPQPNGVLAIAEQLSGNSSRAAWDVSPGRIALTATELPTFHDALQALADELEANQLAAVPPGPPDLGELSFMHPSGVAPAVFFVRNNLLLAVYSLGREDLDVIAFAYRVDEFVRQLASTGRGTE